MQLPRPEPACSLMMYWRPSGTTCTLLSLARRGPEARATSFPAPLKHGAGGSANLSKTRAFNAVGGAEPVGIAELGQGVWRGDRPPAERGIAALDVPIGHDTFVEAQAAARLREKQELLRALLCLPGLQSAWLLLLLCAAPRAQHLLRNVPPAVIARIRKGPR